jgi:hypothetical protein
MSTAKTILGIVPGLQAASLVGANLNAMNGSFGMGKGKRKKHRGHGTGNMMRMGVGNLVGVGLIGATSSMVNSMD